LEAALGTSNVWHIGVGTSVIDTSYEAVSSEEIAMWKSATEDIVYRLGEKLIVVSVVIT
jgi:hypothetical protein